MSLMNTSTLSIAFDLDELSFADACDEAFEEGKAALECAPTLRSAELPKPADDAS